LNEACPKADYKICAYLDRLPNKADALLWSSGIFDELAALPLALAAARPGCIINPRARAPPLSTAA
jgi:hypothetical protein